jgi:hypothetical protein
MFAVHDKECMQMHEMSPVQQLKIKLYMRDPLQNNGWSHIRAWL